MILQLKIYADSNESGQNRLEWLEILEMLWSVLLLIFKTSSVTPHFFYVFNLILSLSTCSLSFKSICTWEVLGANVLKCQEILQTFGNLAIPSSTKFPDLRSGNTGNICSSIWLAILLHCKFKWNNLLCVLPHFWPTCLAAKMRLGCLGNHWQYYRSDILFTHYHIQPVCHAIPRRSWSFTVIQHHTVRSLVKIEANFLASQFFKSFINVFFFLFMQI